MTRWPIDEILARTDLAALLDEFAQPAQRGRRWHCPLTEHDDHHASVTMRRDHRGHERWRCWSGDHRGLRGRSSASADVTRGRSSYFAFGFGAGSAAASPSSSTTRGGFGA